MVTAPVVYAGYGISAAKEQHDDYKGLDVKGKVAVAVLSGGNVDPELFYRLVA